MRKLRVGDKVKVKSKFRTSDYVPEIQKLANTYVTIREVLDYDQYYIQETDGMYCDGKWDIYDFEEDEYYIVSNKHTDGLIRTFWASDNNEYTINLDEAGIYTQKDVDKKDYPLITKDNLNDKCLYDTYFINTKDIELIGKKMTCILN